MHDFWHIIYDGQQKKKKKRKKNVYLIHEVIRINKFGIVRNFYQLISLLNYDMHKSTSKIIWWISKLKLRYLLHFDLNNKLHLGQGRT